MELFFFIPVGIFLIMASLMLGCFCYHKKRYENSQYVIYRVNPNQADTANIPVLQGATDMYVIGLHRPGQSNMQLYNMNNPVVTGFMSNLQHGLPGRTPYTTVPIPQSTYSFVPPPPTYPESQSK